MILYFLTSVLTLALTLAQGVPPQPGQSGTVSGSLHTASGAPAAGVRVSVMVPPEADADARSALFVTLAETDEQGRFRLEGIPPGRYYIGAGRVDQLTYYPGSMDLEGARIFSISAGGAVSNIDFVMSDSSARPSQPLINVGITAVPSGPSFAIPIQVNLAGDAKLPVFAAGGFTIVQLTEKVSSFQVSLSLNSSSALQFTSSGFPSVMEYFVRVENLPEGYSVKSMKFDSDDVTAGTLKIPQTYLQRTVSPVGVGSGRITLPTLFITLAASSLQPVTGVRVSGKLKDTEVRSLYLSGLPGALFADGTFEFRGVPPGRHLLAALGNPPGRPSLAASIVVGDRNFDGVELQATSALPNDVKLPSAPGPVGTHQPGTVIPLASLHGRALEESSGQPIEEGSVKIVGRDRLEVSIGPGGHYEFPRLLPGNYDVEMQIFGHSNIHVSVVVDEDDMILDLTSRRLY